MSKNAKFLKSVSSVVLIAGVLFGSTVVALAGSTQATGDTRADALALAFRYAEGNCAANIEKRNASITDKECSKTSDGSYTCVVTYDCY